jgi:hypothetical protein
MALGIRDVISHSQIADKEGQLDVTGGDRRWIALGCSSVLSTQTHLSLCLIVHITFNLARWTSRGNFVWTRILKTLAKRAGSWEK